MAVGAEPGSAARNHMRFHRDASIGSRRRLHRARQIRHRALRGRLSKTFSDAHLHAAVSFPSPGEARLLCELLDFRHLFSQCCRTSASHVTSDGVIWPKDGCASIAYAATAAVRLSSPGLRPFLARAKKVSPPPSSAALRPADGCVVDRLRPADRHRGRDGRRARTAKEN